MLENNPDSIATSITMPYPGTEIEKDTRINIDGDVSWDDYYHEPEPQVKYTCFPKAVTYTDQMSSEDITLARYLIMSSFKNRKLLTNPESFLGSVDKN